MHARYRLSSAIHSGNNSPPTAEPHSSAWTQAWDNEIYKFSVIHWSLGIIKPVMFQHHNDEHDSAYKKTQKKLVDTSYLEKQSQFQSLRCQCLFIFRPRCQPIHSVYIKSTTSKPHMGFLFSPYQSFLSA